MPTYDPVLACYQESENLDELLERADAALQLPTTTARGMLVCLETDFLQLLDEHAPSTTEFRAAHPVSSEFEVLWSTVFSSCVRLHASDGTTGTLLSLRTAHPEVAFLMTLDSGPFYRASFRPFFASLSPWVATPFLTSSNLVTLLQHAKADRRVSDLVITDFASRSQIQHRRGTRKTRTERTWTEESLDQVVDLLQQSGRWLHSLAFKYRVKIGNQHQRCGSNVSRACQFRTKGNLSWFFRQVARDLSGMVAEKNRFLRDRGRNERADLSPRPVIIEYGEPLFQDKSQNERLMTVLRKLEKAGLSVYHANPYFRASLVDFVDGSSYDVWVLSESRVILTPQLRCTYASIERVSNHILSAFAEGDMQDYREAIGVT
ncbi:MAG: hypothetical protein L0Y58_15775 [Verrucomicrobia subdivision 3 bacterium]|nr:hypothetical protein [Gemmataceae bacterium]MCI0746861.1 hypothetical protein [Limisphaerales bacterium]